MTNKSTLCLLFRDETVDMAFIERTVLGAQIKFMERLPRDEALNEAVAERQHAYCCAFRAIWRCSARCAILPCRRPMWPA
jgi:hypothetical protein